MNKKNVIFIITFVFIILLVCLTGEVRAEETVTIQCEDINFYKVLVSTFISERISVDSFDEINKRIIVKKSEIDNIKELSLVGYLDEVGVQDISGIEKFKNLTKLELTAFWDLEDVSPLGELENLTSLYFTMRYKC